MGMLCWCVGDRVSMEAVSHGSLPVLGQQIHSKTSPRSPEFKHKITKESLWIDGWHDPGWVKDMLEKKVKASTAHIQDPCLMEECGQCSFSSGVKLNASTAQGLHEKSGWETLSLEEALTSLERMPTAQNFTCIFYKCRTLKNPAYVKRCYALMCKSGLENFRFLENHLILMLVQVGNMCDAHRVFNKLVDRDLCSWNSLISGYIKCGESQYALNLYQKMQEESVHPNKYTFVAVLKACARLKDAGRGQEIHVEIVRKGLEREIYVGSTLVVMYAKCGSLAAAWEAFNKLPVRNQVSWNALMAGYAEHGLGKDALDCLEEMRLEGLPPSTVTFVCSLKACGSIGAIGKGQEIHAEILRKWLEKDLVVGRTLVDMYAKCGFLAEAREAFDKLPARDEVSWTALMSGYVQHELGAEALNCLEQMQLEGVSPDAVTFVCSLKACGSIGAIDKGREIQANIVRMGLERHLYVGSALVDMYAKCGLLLEAREVFDKLPLRNKVSWNALMAGYAEHGLGQYALHCLEQMQLEGLSPDAVTFVCSLKACGTMGALDKGEELHAEISRRGLERQAFVGSMLVDMYAKCGSVGEAQEVFDRVPVRNEVSWNALIAGYAEHGLCEEALNCLKQMKLEGLSPDSVTFGCILKACGSIGAVDKGLQIHAEVIRKGLENYLFVDNALVDMYVKCGFLAAAQEVFDKLPVREESSWNALMAGYAEHGLGEEVLNCLQQMQLEGLSLNAVTFVCSLNACSSIKAVDKGREIHSEIGRKGLEKHIVVGRTLVGMYSKCGTLTEGQEVFDKLPVQDKVSWTILMAGYAEHGLGKHSLNCLEQMQLESLPPDAVTFTCSLKACGSIGARDKGREIHAEIARKGLEGNLSVANTLVDMYAKCGLVAETREAFDRLPVRDVVSWTALMAGYAQYGLGQDALNCLEWMNLDGLSPNAVTFVSSLKACGSMGSIDEGRGIHAEVARKGLERHTVVGNTLVDMYGQCAALAEALETFDKLPLRDCISWGALMAGCALVGESEIVFRMLERMRGEGVRPNVVIFSIVIAVCSHSGLVDKGQKYFEAMRKDCGMTPTIEHHIGIIDLLGRAGQLDEAVAMVKKMPFHPSVVVWVTLLGTCQKWSNVELGRLAFERAVQLDDKSAAAYVLMSNIYADAEMEEKKKGVKSV